MKNVAVLMEDGAFALIFLPYVISTIDLNLTLLLITRKHVRVYWMSCKMFFFPALQPSRHVISFFQDNCVKC